MSLGRLPGWSPAIWRTSPCPLPSPTIVGAGLGRILRLHDITAVRTNRLRGDLKIIHFQIVSIGSDASRGAPMRIRVDISGQNHIVAFSSWILQ